MYKVMVVRDALLDRFEIPSRLMRAHCVEFTADVADGGLCSSVLKTKPDVLVISRKCFDENSAFLPIDILHIHCMVVYDSFGEDTAGLPDNVCTAFDVQSDEDIVSAVSGLINRIKSVRAKENFAKMVIREADRLKPIIREQFFKEFVLGVGNTDEIFRIYCTTFNMSPNCRAHTFLFRPECEIGFDDYFFLKNIVEGHIGTDNIIVSTIVKDHILVVSGMQNGTKVSAMLHKMSKVFEKYYSYRITTVYSGLHALHETAQVYEKLCKALDYCFYTGDGAIVCAEDIATDASYVSLEPNYGAIERAVRTADCEKMQMLLYDFFKDIERAKAEPALAKTYCLELFVCIIRCCEVEKIDKYMKGIIELQELKTLKEIKDYILRVANEIIGSGSARQLRIYSSLINSTMDIIEKNIGNENLSLRWIANNILYTNVDYLGKLFKKEIGENFSHYVMEKRMEMAKNLIVEGKKDRIYEVAEKVGYGSNSQYFSQVFKKYTGVSPLEYKEYAKNLGAG